jgi:hypothetical protein
MLVVDLLGLHVRISGGDQYQPTCDDNDNANFNVSAKHDDLLVMNSSLIMAIAR